MLQTVLASESGRRRTSCMDVASPRYRHRNGGSSGFEWHSPAAPDKGGSALVANEHPYTARNPPVRFGGALRWSFVLLLCAPSLFISRGVLAQTIPPVSVAFSGSPDPVAPGESIVYKIDIGNQSSVTATGTFKVTATVPQTTTITGFPVVCNVTCRYGGYVTWSNLTLAAGASAHLQFTAVVDNSVTNPPPADGAILSSDVTVSIGGGTITTTAAVAVTTGSKTLDLAISGTPNRVVPGGMLTYTLSYGNRGSAGVPTLLHVPVPVGTTFVSATGGGAVNGGAVEWNLGTLPSGFFDQRDFTVQVGAGLASGTFISAVAELRDSTSQQSLVRDSASNMVSGATLLSMTVKGTPNPVLAGGAIVYEIDIANLSTNTATGTFNVTATVPQSTTITGFPVVCSVTCRYGGYVTWSNPSLAAGASAHLQFTAVVDNSATNPPPPNGSILVTDVTAFAFGGMTVRSAIVVGNGSQLDLAISGTPNRVVPGGMLTYTLSYGNRGSAGVPTLLHVPVPVGTTFVSATGGGAVNGGAVEWNLGTLPSGFFDQRDFTVQVEAGVASGTFISAAAELRDPASQQSLVRNSASNMVSSSTLLSMTVKAAPNPVLAGGAIVYEIDIANLSTNTATGTFNVTATVPQSTTITGFPVVCNVTCRYGGYVTWSNPSLAAGASTHLQFTAVVDNSASNPPPPNGSILVTDVTAFAFGGMTVRSAIVVGNGSQLDLAISGTPNRVVPGGMLTYTLSYGNRGSAGVPMLLHVPVPVGTTFVSGTGGGAVNNGAVEWNLGTLPGGFFDQREFTVQVGADLASGTFISAAAELRDSTSQQSLVRGSASNMVSGTTLLSLTVKGTPNPVLAGGAIVYEIDIANLSTNTATGTFNVTATVPQSTTITGFPVVCNVTCRYGGYVTWSNPSLAAGGSTHLQFTAVVDNSASNPPPPNGSILVTDVTAFAFGDIRASNTVFVGMAAGGVDAGAGGAGGAGGATGTGGTTAGAGGNPVDGGPIGTEAGGNPTDAGIIATEVGASPTDAGLVETGDAGSARDSSLTGSGFDGSVTDSGVPSEGPGGEPADSGVTTTASGDTGTGDTTSGDGPAPSNEAGAGHPKDTTTGCSCDLSRRTEPSAPLSLAAIMGLAFLALRRRERERSQAEQERSWFKPGAWKSEGCSPKLGTPELGAALPAALPRAVLNLGTTDTQDSGPPRNPQRSPRQSRTGPSSTSGGAFPDRHSARRCDLGAT
jgi:hypothetical protein